MKPHEAGLLGALVVAAVIALAYAARIGWEMAG